MTYYINPIWFYLVSLSDSLKSLLIIAGTVALVIAFLVTIIWLSDDCGTWTEAEMDDDEKTIFKRFKKFMIASVMVIFIAILIPSKETCIEMMIASQVTHENVTATKEEIYEIVDYITDKVKGEEE